MRTDHRLMDVCILLSMATKIQTQLRTQVQRTNNNDKAGNIFIEQFVIKSLLRDMAICVRSLFLMMLTSYNLILFCIIQLLWNCSEYSSLLYSSILSPPTNAIVSTRGTLTTTLLIPIAVTIHSCSTHHQVAHLRHHSPLCLPV